MGRKRTGRPAGRPPLKGVTMTELLSIRLTASQKDRAMNVPSTSGSPSAFWQEVITEVAEGVQVFRAGSMSDEDFKLKYGEVIFKVVTEGTARQYINK